MNNRPILIVDDSDFERGLLSKALSLKGSYQILEAQNGDECLEIIGKQTVGLILMDIMMPGTFGSDVLKKIREQFNAIELPIIMVTSKSDAVDIISCLQSGANDYITKPVNFEVAISRITTHLKLAAISNEMSRLKEMATVDAMITTYNHEINNPLAIAISCIESKDIAEPATKERLKVALWRVADIVKKIKSLSEKKEIEYEPYASSSKMFKLK